jgi:hypothetical protein
VTDLARIEQATETLFVEILAALADVDDDDCAFPRKMLVEIADSTPNGDRAEWLEFADRNLTAGRLRTITREALGLVAAGAVGEMRKSS